MNYLFIGISNLFDYIIPNPFFSKDNSGTIQPIHKGMCLKVYVIALSDFEVAYYDSAIQYFNHYITGPPNKSSMQT